MKDNAIAANDTNDTTLDIGDVSLVEASDALGNLVLDVNNTRFLLTRKGKDAPAIIDRPRTSVGT